MMFVRASTFSQHIRWLEMTDHQRIAQYTRVVGHDGNRDRRKTTYTIASNSALGSPGGSRYERQI